MAEGHSWRPLPGSHGRQMHVEPRGKGERSLPLAVSLGILPVVAVPLWLGRRLGGHSGDSYGACVEWSETLALLLMAVCWLLLPIRLGAGLLAAG